MMVELIEFDIEYQPRKAIKAQVVANVIAYFYDSKEPELEEEIEGRIYGSKRKSQGKGFKRSRGRKIMKAIYRWVIFARKKHNEVDCDPLMYSIHLEYKMTNNKVEYEAPSYGFEHHCRHASTKDKGLNGLTITRELGEGTF